MTRGGEMLWICHVGTRAPEGRARSYSSSRLGDEEKKVCCSVFLSHRHELTYYSRATAELNVESSLTARRVSKKRVRTS